MFGQKIKPEGTEKPLDHGPVEYIGGHKAYPKSTYSEIYFYEDRMELQAYKLKIPFKQIKNVDSTRIFGIVGGLILFTYGIIPTLQPSNFGRVYAAYGGFFIICSILWGMIIDKKKPDNYEVIGSVIAVLGAAIIFYAPR